MTLNVPLPKWAIESEAHLLAGNPQRSLEVLDQVSSLENLSHQRIMLHLRSQAQVYLGDLEGAKSQLLRAEKFFGENIAILRDLACIYHQTGETHQWRNSVEALARRLSDVEAQLTIATWAQTHVTLGKFYEELGRIDQAIRHYELVLERCQQSPHKDLATLALIQRLRVEALFENGPRLGEYYHHLLALPSGEFTFDLWVEREHSLMLAEIELVGPLHAWARALRLLQDARLCAADRRLVIADFLAEATLRQVPLPNQASDYVQELAEGDAFEREMQDFLKLSTPSQETLLRVSDLASELPWASYLRIMTLYHQINEAPEIRIEVDRKLRLLLSGLPPEARYFWLSRLRSQITTETPELSYNRAGRSLIFQGRHIDLSKKRAFCSVLEILLNEPRVEVDQMIRKLWDSSFSPEHLHRLRMTVHRLNQYLFELCAIPRVIEMTAEHVSLRGSVTLSEVG